MNGLAKVLLFLSSAGALVLACGDGVATSDGTSAAPPAEGVDVGPAGSTFTYAG